MNPCSNLKSLVTINLNELVGKSLNTINNNFLQFNKEICSEAAFLSNFKNLYFSVYKKMADLNVALKGRCEAHVLFDSFGNILKQDGILQVFHLSLGIYQINFSSLLNEYIVIPDTVFSSLVFISIINETPTSVTISTRLSDGSLVNPEKISLTFFA